MSPALNESSVVHRLKYNSVIKLHNGIIFNYLGLPYVPVCYQQERERWPDLLIVAENSNHDHSPETAQETVAKVVDKMKERARNEIVSVN